MHVKLYEYRDDIRQMEAPQGRNMNLVLSVRGRSALSMAGLEDEMIDKHCVSMHGRMVHFLNGCRRPIHFDKNGRCIYSVARKVLNETLLNEAEKNPNVEIFFKHKFLDCDFKTRKCRVLGPDGQVKEETFEDLLIGSDGAYSAVRRRMIKLPRFDYSQSYIDHGYVELCIPPTDTGEFAMEKNYLHIWPRHNFLMKALPNLDSSFTVTLFMTFNMFEKLNTPEKLLQFFEEQFPDSITLIGREKLVTDFFKTQPSALVSIKCNPYHVDDKVLIIGDAAHAMVPFYEQAVNAGFEDCEILSKLLEEYCFDLKRVLPAFTERRHQDVVAICDLSMRNYKEMRYLLTSKKSLLRNLLDELMFSFFPSVWIPLNTMITFSKLRYSHCILRKQMQDKILWSGLSIAVVGFSIVIFTRI